MCRLLFVKSNEPFEVSEKLNCFSQIAAHSPEYQGHGWGLGIFRSGKWEEYRTIKPIWEDDLSKFGKANLLVVHARSAFQDEGIQVENNMPFFGDGMCFAFNGELRGVRLKTPGRIGAEKIFNVLRDQVSESGDWFRGLTDGARLIESRTRYVRALNILVSDGNRAWVYSNFSERPEYFTLHYKRGKEITVCSAPFEGETDWEPVPVKSVQVFGDAQVC